MALDEPDAGPRMVRTCSLDTPTQSLIRLLFDHDMFSNAMKCMEIGEGAGKIWGSKISVGGHDMFSNAMKCIEIGEGPKGGLGGGQK